MARLVPMPQTGRTVIKCRHILTPSRRLSAPVPVTLPERYVLVGAGFVDEELIVLTASAPVSAGRFRPILDHLTSMVDSFEFLIRDRPGPWGH